MKSNGKDSNTSIATEDNKGQLVTVGVEHIKAAYIVDGCSAQDLAAKFYLPVEVINKIIEENQLDKLRAAHVKHGLAQLQSIQLVQAEKLMNIENSFKKMRILQLEKTLEDYAAYYAKYGHFYKVHPLTLEILKDTNGIPVQIKLPNVGPEIAALKESFSLSEGLKQMLGAIDDIINKKKDEQPLDADVIDVTNFNTLFSKKKAGEDD